MKDKNGYGKMKISGISYRAHRLSHAIANGADPGELWVLHRCDNPSCVNPDHLFLGTVRDNVDDMCAKGRKGDSSGESNGQAKLTTADVTSIRERYAVGETGENLARDFNVSFQAVHLVVTGKTWAAAGGEINSGKNAATCERNGRAKLSPNQVHQIICMRSEGGTLKLISEHYGVSIQTVWKVSRGTSWRSLGILSGVPA